MTASSARQWERVEFQAPVQLVLRSAAREEPTTLHAHAVNVSEGGMQVVTDDPLPLGELVTCSLLLEGRPAALPGHVRWTRPSAPGFEQPGSGIQFDELSQLDSELLRHLVSRGGRGDQPVELFFPSMREPVHARAFTSDGGLYITAALPVLEREAPIEFQFAPEGPRFRGRIARVTVRERGRTPHLEVELAVHAREAPRFRRYTMYDDAEAAALTDAEEAAQHDATSGLHPLPSRVRVRAQTIPVWSSPSLPEHTGFESESAARARVLTPDASIPKLFPARIPRLAMAALVGVGVVFTCTLVTWVVLAPSAFVPRDSYTPRSSSDARAKAALAAEHIKAAAARAAPVAHEARVTAASQALPTRVAPAAHFVTQSKPSARPLATSARPAPALSPMIIANERTTEVRVPIDGSLEGMRSTRWASPLAVVVDLPNATLGLPESTTVPNLGHVKRVTLAQGASGVRMRVFLDAVPQRHDVQLQNGTLIVLVDHVDRH